MPSESKRQRHRGGNTRGPVASGGSVEGFPAEAKASDPLSRLLLLLLRIANRPDWMPWLLVAGVCLYLYTLIVPLEMLPQNRYYNLLAESFLTGRLDLPVNPPRELLALSDPYDPAQNGPYRLHDVALYGGKYYLYHGATPALLLFAPLRGLFGWEIDQGTAAWVFLCCGLVAATWALSRVLALAPSPAARWLMPVGVAALGLANDGPFLLVRPDVYEVAIACGYALGMTAFALLLAGIGTRGRMPARALPLAGLCAGLAVGARPNYIVFAPVLLAAACSHALACGHGLLNWKFHRLVAGLLAPFAACIVTILAYNYARFGSALQFGTSYLLMSFHPKDNKFFDLATYGDRLWRFLTYPCLLDWQFPFTHLPRGTVSWGEPEVGALWAAPLVVLTGLWLCVLVLSRFRRRLGLGPWELVVIPGTGVLMLLLLPALTNCTLRYLLDFLGLLLLSSFFVWSQVRARLVSQPGLRRACDALCLLLVAWGCWVGVAFGTNDTPPSAIRHFYSARKLVDQGRPSEALEELSTALTVAPDFYLARSLRARLMASQTGGNPAEAAAEFSRAMRDYTSQAAAAQNRGYMPAFQGLVIGDPVAEYALVAQPLLERRETAAALSALRGMAEAFAAAGFGQQALGILQAVKAVAERSNLPDFARMVGEMIGPAASQSAPPSAP